MNIQELIKNEECPILNAAIYSNGDMYVMEDDVVKNHHHIRVLCKSTLDSYFEFNSTDEVCSFDILCKKETAYYIAYGCEGSYGSEGLIYLFDKKKNEYIWLLHLNLSNPFEKIEIKDDEIIAINNNCEKWCVPIQNPHNVKFIG